MAAKLPMTARKNIRDTEAKRDEFLAKINAATGHTFKLVPDFETNHGLVEDGWKDRIGTLYQGEGAFLPELVSMFESAQFKDPLFKAEFDKTVTKDEIRFRVGTVNRAQTGGQSSYNDVFFEDGGVVLVHDKSPCNLGDIARFQLNKVRGLNESSKIPLYVRQNLAKNEAKKDEALAAISKATGEKWTFNDACMEAVWKVYESNPDFDRYKDQVGDYFYAEALTNLASNITAICKDDMLQEGFNEKFSAKTIEFRYVKDLSGYWKPLEEGGKLVVQFKDLCNFGNLSSDSSFPIVAML